MHGESQYMKMLSYIMTMLARSQKSFFKLSLKKNHKKNAYGQQLTKDHQ